MSKLITTTELKTATGCKRDSDLETVLRKNGVRFLFGKNGIFTTVDAVNAAMGLQSQPVTDQADNIEIL